MSYPQASFGLPYAIFSPRNLSLNTLNDIYVLNRENQLERVFDNADMDATAVRNWGIQQSSATTNSGSFGGTTRNTRINPTQSTQIALGQFEGLRNPDTAFEGAMTFGYGTTPGAYYVPGFAYSGYNQIAGSPFIGSHTATTFTGTIGGRNATHTLKRIQNAGFLTGDGYGVSMVIQNTTGAYSATATDWNRIELTFGTNSGGVSGTRYLSRTRAINVNANGSIAFGGSAFASPTASAQTAASPAGTTIYEYSVFWSGFTTTNSFFGVPLTGTYGYFGTQSAHTNPATFKIIL